MILSGHFIRCSKHSSCDVYFMSSDFVRVFSNTSFLASVFSFCANRWDELFLWSKMYFCCSRDSTCPLLWNLFVHVSQLQGFQRFWLDYTHLLLVLIEELLSFTKIIIVLYRPAIGPFFRHIKWFMIDFDYRTRRGIATLQSLRPMSLIGSGYPFFQ